jgi:hypothetical protein
VRRVAIVAAVALLAGGCATLGREYPRCEFPFVDVPIPIVMEIQALPGASFGPCLNDLAPGWSYHHMQHESGRVHFWLDSDRLGDRFVEVTMTESCDPGSATARAHPNPGIQRFIDATEEVLPVSVVIVPIGSVALDYAAAVGVALAGASVRGRPLMLSLDQDDNPSAAIQAARTRGRIVIGVDDIDMRQGTVQVALPNGETDYGLSLSEALEEIEDHIEEGSYHAAWFHLFDGGCVTFEFDAEGPGVETLIADVEATIGFADLADLKAQAATAGFVLDESELDG